MEENNIFLASFSPLNDWVFPKIVISQKRTLKVHLKIRESLFLYRTKQDDISEGRKNEVHRPFSDQQVKKKRKKENSNQVGGWRSSRSRALVSPTTAGAQKIPQKEVLLTFLPTIYLQIPAMSILGCLIVSKFPCGNDSVSYKRTDLL